uniref:E3 ubiquitin-protein ligase RNF220 n=1 Tax=Hucho hucho TaxID=62062 RepID=A0A4W5NSE6_9TELE
MIRMTSILGGCEGSVFVSSSTSKEGRGDSNADLDVDRDDTLDYGGVQCTEADIIPCSGQDPGEVEEREALRVAVLNGGTLSNRVTLEHSKWTNEGSPSTSNGERNKLDNSIASLHRTCKNSDIDMVFEDSGLTTLDSLKSHIRDLEKQLSRGDRHNCLICRDTYTTPLTSIQCWHAHCEECWLRTLGAKKLCPQCNTITSPGDLRRVFL